MQTDPPIDRSGARPPRRRFSRTGARSPHRRFSRTGVTALLALAVALAACSGGSRSVEAFCERLEEGEQSVRAVAADAETRDEPLLALAFLLGGIGEYQAMVDGLAEVAPEEIRPEMERARDSFQRQSEATSGAGSLTQIAMGAIGGVIDGMTHRTAFEAVDNFAISNCGTPVFSLSATAAISETGSDPVVPAEDPCPGLPHLTEAEVGSDLADALAVAAELGVEGVDDVATAADTLEPVADTLLEALARIGWDDGGDLLAQQINESVEATCGRQLIAHGIVDDLAVTGPRPMAPGLLLLGSYDPSCTNNRFSYKSDQGLLHTAYNETHVVVWSCSSGPIVVSLEDGTPLHLGPEDQFNISDDSGLRPVLTDDHVYWVIREEVAPTGLEAAGEVQTLFRRSLSPPYETDEVRRLDGETRLRVLDAAGGHVLVRVGQELLVLNEDGSEALSVPADPGNLTHLLDSIWFTAISGAPLVDVRTASLVDPSASGATEWDDRMRPIGDPDQCAVRTVTTDDRRLRWMLHRAPDGAASIRTIELGGSWPSPLEEATVASDPGPRVHDLGGDLIWSSPENRPSEVFGGRLYAAGEDGTIFEVDPFNDELAAPTLNGEVLLALFDIETVHVHRESGDVVMFRHNISGRDTDQFLRIISGACEPS